MAAASERPLRGRSVARMTNLDKRMGRANHAAHLFLRLLNFRNRGPNCQHQPDLDIGV
jgi:hypothetical protein